MQHVSAKVAEGGRHTLLFADTDWPQIPTCCLSGHLLLSRHTQPRISTSVSQGTRIPFSEPTGLAKGSFEWTLHSRTDHIAVMDVDISATCLNVILNGVCFLLHSKHRFPI